MFVGIANVAGYYWCAMQAVLKSRNDLAFFAAYVYDRASYSLQLGLINKMPKSDEALLNVGNEIPLADIESLLKKRTERHYITQAVEMQAL